LHGRPPPSKTAWPPRTGQARPSRRSAVDGARASTTVAGASRTRQIESFAEPENEENRFRSVEARRQAVRVWSRALVDLSRFKRIEADQVTRGVVRRVMRVVSGAFLGRRSSSRLLLMSFDHRWPAAGGRAGSRLIVA